ncbi:MAG: glycoside hydrolase, partial [Candidatus Dormibacteraeota bacterium]|nr:glycoside hydrolase [Candidatus Dormibacteraeota bacterium]
MRPLHLAFVWHLHQPYHKDDVSGTTLLPWVRLRAAKDYRKLAALLADHPGLRQTFNLVPSLLVQLEDRARGGSDDLFLRVSRKPPADLSAGERAFVLRWLRESTRQPRVRASPRYAELAGRAEHDAFSTGDLRDVQVWANLAWCGPHWVGGHPVLSELRNKDRHFTEDDKRAVLDAMDEEVARVIPAYRALARDGRAELTCSPLCHPILPLLVDLEAAREGTPAIDLPALPFRHPEDAARHIRAGREYVERVMGVRPRGLWPPELAVGERVERLVGEAGIDWMVADEGVLARSLHLPSEPTARQVADPELLYRPAQLTRDGHPVSLVFRDAALSGLVGFDYPRMPAREAARDFLARLRGVRDLQADHDLLVTVALDGASPWDWYPREGQDFLEALFDELDRAEDIVSTTVSDFLDGHPVRKPLGRLHAGSWIGANLDAWVGGPEHSRAWAQLARARQAV